MNYIMTLLMILTVTSCGTQDSSTGDSPTKINTPVPDTAQGLEPGMQGPKGDKGDTGASGKDGRDAPIPEPNTWLDTLTGLSWHIGGTAWALNSVTASIACPMPWRQPTKTEATTAVMHGLGTASAEVSGPLDVWTSTSDTSGYFWIVTFSNSTSTEVLTNTLHGIFCVK